MGMMIDSGYVPQGWQCPICKRVYSPTTMMCMYCGEEGATKIYTTTSATGTIKVFDWNKEQEDGNDNNKV